MHIIGMIVNIWVLLLFVFGMIVMVANFPPWLQNKYETVVKPTAMSISGSTCPPNDIRINTDGGLPDKERYSCSIGPQQIYNKYLVLMKDHKYLCTPTHDQLYSLPAEQLSRIQNRCNSLNYKASEIIRKNPKLSAEEVMNMIAQRK